MYLVGAIIPVRVLRDDRPYKDARIKGFSSPNFTFDFHIILASQGYNPSYNYNYEI